MVGPILNPVTISGNVFLCGDPLNPLLILTLQHRSTEYYSTSISRLVLIIIIIIIIIKIIIMEIKDKSGASGSRCIGFSVKEAGRLLGATRN